MIGGWLSMGLQLQVRPLGRDMRLERPWRAGAEFGESGIHDADHAGRPGCVGIHRHLFFGYGVVVCIESMIT